MHPVAILGALAVVVIHQRHDARLGIMLAQCGQHRRGAHEVADIVAADHQNLHAATLSCFSKRIITVSAHTRNRCICR